MIINDKEFEAVFASTKTKCIAFSLDSEEALTPLNSSIASVPYWEKTKLDYPSYQGEPQKLLAQINFEELKEHFDIIPNFPKSGILQFFMPSPHAPTLPNSSFGEQEGQSAYFNNSFDTYPNKLSPTRLFMPKPENAPVKNLLKNYAVRFHSSPDLENHFLNEEQFLANNSPAMLPLNGTISKPMKMFPNSKVEYCGLGDEYWSYYLYEHTTMNDSQEKRLFNCINGGVKLNGYAYFHSTDPRPVEGFNRENPWVLLLQIDSIYIAKNKASSNQINLANNKGIISFFIRQKDLINQNFNSNTILVYQDKGHHPYQTDALEALRQQMGKGNSAARQPSKNTEPPSTALDTNVDTKNNTDSAATNRDTSTKDTNNSSSLSLAPSSLAILSDSLSLPLPLPSDSSVMAPAISSFATATNSLSVQTNTVGFPTVM